TFLVAVAHPPGGACRLDDSPAAKRVFRALSARPKPAYPHLPDTRPDRRRFAPPTRQSARGPNLFGGGESGGRAAGGGQIRAESLAWRLAEQQREGEPRADKPA